ncbi:4-coumarate--CoA ligase-like 7 [Chionoecetes opilio]|uniref:4-coumarate--CoA ligase-like 7 n=1 Tax=Chionoecetes opilio TaxID=41210 RepID=A0A8J4XU80_CHIOP|nr:4-coumarate--CoA ligase-like 7 [Chionoecetes opilio]
MVALGVEKEEHVLRCTWENIAPVPQKPFITYILDRCAQAGDIDALVDGVSGERLKYSQLTTWVRDVSYGWQAAGLEAGQVVCLVTPNCILALPTFLAAVAAKGIVTFANPLSTPDELRRHVTHSNSSWIVVHPLFLKNVQAAIKDNKNIKGINILGDKATDDIKPVTSLRQEAPAEWACTGGSGDQVLHLPYSSGTTGLPKGVEITAGNWLAMLSNIGRKEYLNINSEEVILGILPFFHIFGIGMGLASLCYGATMVTLPRFIPDIFLKALQTYKVTLVPVVPPLAIFLAKHEVVAKFDLSAMKSIVCGAAPLSGDVQEILSKKFPEVTVRQGFGMTETTLAVFASESHEPGAVGHITAHSEAKGYFNDVKATSELIDSKGWLHTGDVGHFNDSGIFYIVDRIKELIKYKGFQVAPAELEGLLVTHESIADAAVIGVVDEEAGELPKAYIVQKPGKIVDSEDIIAWVKERVAPFKRLRGGVEIIDAIPRSPAGKILRKNLRQQPSGA